MKRVGFCDYCGSHNRRVVLSGGAPGCAPGNPVIMTGFWGREHSCTACPSLGVRRAGGARSWSRKPLRRYPCGRRRRDRGSPGVIGIPAVSRRRLALRVHRLARAEADASRARLTYAVRVMPRARAAPSYRCRSSSVSWSVSVMHVFTPPPVPGHAIPWRSREPSEVVRDAPCASIASAAGTRMAKAR